MTLFFYYGAGDLGNEAVRMGDAMALSECAEAGLIGMSMIQIDDPTDDWSGIVGHHVFKVVDTACTSWPRLFTGYFADRAYARADSLLLDAARRIDGTVYDANAALNFEVIRGDDANRPEETDIERIAWWLGSGFAGPILDDLTNVHTANAKNMDASDYRGRTGDDLMADCGQTSSKNYWVAFDQDLGGLVLHYYASSRAFNSSSQRISNVLADVDGSTVYAPSKDATLDRDPSRVWSGVYMGYGAGSKAVYRTNSTTLAAIGHKRETSITDPSVTTAAKAEAKADAFLDEAETEFDRIRVTLYKVRPEDVNLIRAGQRIQVKFTHMPGYEDFTWIRVAKRTVRPDGETQNHYRLELELANAKLSPTNAVPHRPGRPEHEPPPLPPDEAEVCDTTAFSVGISHEFQQTIIGGITTNTFGTGGVNTGSEVWPNYPYTEVGCVIGCGGWGPGLRYIESWMAFSVGDLDDQDVQGELTIGASGTRTGVADGGSFIVGIGHGTPTGPRQYTGIGAVPCAAGGTVIVPRSALSQSEQNYLVFAPAWNASTGMFFCADDLISGCNGPQDGGEGNSGRATAPTVTATWQNICASGTTPWVSPLEEVDGSTDTFTLIDWDGTGTPDARVGALILSVGDDYTVDRANRQVTLADTPEEFAAVAFRYQAETD